MKYDKDTDTILIFMKLLILIILSRLYITLIKINLKILIIIYKLSRFSLTKLDGIVDEFKDKLYQMYNDMSLERINKLTFKFEKRMK